MEVKKINYSDSLLLDKTWNTFLHAMLKKDDKKLRELSLSRIYCDFCTSPNSKATYPGGSIVLIDTFINQIYRDFLGSPLFKAIAKGRCHYSGELIPDYKPGNLPDNYGRDLYLFDVWIRTYLPGEWAKGHEGQSHAFQFVKIKGKYKFFGMTSIP